MKHIMAILTYTELEICLNVTTYVDGNEDWFYGDCQISKANMFTIKQIDPPIELQCEINNDKLW